MHTLKEKEHCRQDFTFKLHGDPPFSTLEKMYLDHGLSSSLIISGIFCLRVFCGIIMPADTPGGSLSRSDLWMMPQACSPSCASSYTTRNWKSVRMPERTRSRSFSCCSLRSKLALDDMAPTGTWLAPRVAFAMMFDLSCLPLLEVSLPHFSSTLPIFKHAICSLAV